jgi:hypothetical protein
VTGCTPLQLEFSGFNRRKIQASFSGGHVSSDAGGYLLLRQVDRRLGLFKQVSCLLSDPRRIKSCEHDLTSLLRQRVYPLALGYEDLNDHETLRHDLALQTGVERETELVSASTLCRLENRADREAAWTLHQVMVDQFIKSFKRPPSRLVLDFDVTDDAVHGKQEGRFFHGFYNHYCFLPLYVFCGEQRLVSYLRPSKIDGAKHAWAILSLLVKRLRRAWPEVRIVFRGDSGFCRHRMFDWCEKNDVDYIVTNIEGDPQQLYDKLYCKRGDMENRIKEQQLDLFADRTSCHHWWANQFRLLLASLAYTLLESIRRLALRGTELAKAQCGTIRLKLLKVGAVIIKNTRRIRFLLSSAYPHQQLFKHVAEQLDSS